MSLVISSFVSGRLYIKSDETLMTVISQRNKALLPTGSRQKDLTKEPPPLLWRPHQTSNTCRLLQQSLTPSEKRPTNTRGSILPILWSKWLLNTTSYLWKVSWLLGKTNIVCLKAVTEITNSHQFNQVASYLFHTKICHLPILAQNVWLLLWITTVKQLPPPYS